MHSISTVGYIKHAPHKYRCGIASIVAVPCEHARHIQISGIIDKAIKQVICVRAHVC